MFRKSSTFNKKWAHWAFRGLGIIVFGVVAILALSSCWSYHENTVPVTSPTPATILPRRITHSTLPLGEVWRMQVQKTYQYAGSASIPSSDVFSAQPDVLYVVTNHPAAKDVLTPLQILAVDARTGQQRWASEPMGHIHSLAASPATLFVASIYGISAYNASDGNKKWASNQPPPAHESYEISFSDGALYLITDRDARYSYTQIDPETGLVGIFQESGRVLSKIDSKYRYTWQPIDILWMEDIKSSQAKRIIARPRSADPIRENDILAIPYLDQITSTWHSVLVLDLLTDQVLWDCKECFASDIAVDNSKLYAIRKDGALTEYDLETGQMNGSIEFDGGSQIDPYTTLYGIASSNGYVFVYFGDTQELIVLGPTP